MVRLDQAGVLGGLTPEQRAARAHAPFGDTADDRVEPFRHDAAKGDVVQQEQRLGSAHHQVVDHHRDQIQADGVMLVHRLSDRQLGAHPVAGRRQQRFAVVAAQREKSGESAELAEHLGSGGFGRERLEQFDGAIPGFDIDSGRCICHARGSRVFSAVGHRDKGYRARRRGYLTTRDTEARDAAARRPALPPATSRDPRCLPARGIGEHVLDDVFTERGLAGQFDRIPAVEAGRAEPRGGLLGGGDQTPQRDVSQRVGVDGMPHRFEHFVFVFDGVRDQLGRRGEVDPVEARPLHWRRGDPHMHFDGAGLSQHPDQRALGVAPHDRVVDDDEPLAADDFLEWVELQPDSELADGLRRLNKRAPDVGVLRQALPVGDAGFLRITDRGRGSGFRNADHQVGVDRAFAGQPTTDLKPGAVHRPACDRAVRPRQVDVFENAALGFGIGEAGRPDTIGVDGQKLARLDVADERGTDNVQSGGFRRHHPAAVQPPQ